MGTEFELREFLDLSRRSQFYGYFKIILNRRIFKAKIDIGADGTLLYSDYFFYWGRVVSV